ncbi:MAG: hypothetical protein B9J98_05975 [Candidatus Terraquivivens tikiterensis]|uniref:Polymerase nucleotidyl transferase domain-containing protein n=1 Tax=Candidatus Terraquivivens tikiterensis TaxID=1980982 RepID=A0A2R7Y1T3_9ARCH|nr:MAG: hypothetical protein B9J98_05975 [Candidatus Terraquivivens tikiterensis]
MEIIERRKKERTRIIEEAREWVSTLGFRLTVILIGSYARGDFNLWSDVDILLVSDVFQGNPLNRLKMVNPPPGYEVIPVNTYEFLENMRKKNVLIQEASKHGIILRDDLNLAKHLKKTEEQ